MALIICLCYRHPRALVVGLVREMVRGLVLLWRAVDHLQHQRPMACPLDHVPRFHHPCLEEEEEVTIGTEVLDSIVSHLPTLQQARSLRIILLG